MEAKELLRHAKRIQIDIQEKERIKKKLLECIEKTQRWAKGEEVEFNKVPKSKQGFIKTKDGVTRYYK
jgi:hypothetical protein